MSVRRRRAIGRAARAFGAAGAVWLGHALVRAEPPQPVPRALNVEAPAERAAQDARGCPPEMARVHHYCVDRWEMVTVDATTGETLSPYYPPHPRLLRDVRQLWELERRVAASEATRQMPLPALPVWQSQALSYAPRAVSRPGHVPQAYLSFHLAALACKNAGKRLCTEKEWVTACKGRAQTRFPYGDVFDRQRCNVYRYLHPGYVLHGNSSVGHRDPRLNLVFENGEPLLRPTGETPGCVSRWGDDVIYDMVGNLDEWVDDEGGVFVGGFYARSTTSGCEARVGSHAPAYYDYSTGARCCKDAGSSGG